MDKIKTFTTYGGEDIKSSAKDIQKEVNKWLSSNSNYRVKNILQTSFHDEDSDEALVITVHYTDSEDPFS